MGFGYFGPHPKPAPTTAPTASLVSPDQIAGISAAPSARPIPPGGIEAIGLAPVEPNPGQISESWLPPRITSLSLAAVGLRLFYIVGSDRIESSLIGSSADAQVLANVPRCDAVYQLAAAGNELAYVVTSPAGAAAEIGGCGATSAVSWTIWLLDLRGGSPHQVAHGTLVPSSIEIAEFPTHLALTASAYAFDRPTAPGDPEQGTTVEVHAIDGKPLWSSQSQAPVTGVMLGGSRLAVLTQTDAQSGGPKTLWISDASHPGLAAVARPASSASLSTDGSYLAWDVSPEGSAPESPPQREVAIEMLDSGRVQTLVTLTHSAARGSLQPSVSTTRSGPAVGWIATAPNGSAYPAFRLAGGGPGAVLPTLQQPAWMSVQGATLIWMAESPDGWLTEAFAVDILSLAAS